MKPNEDDPKRIDWERVRAQLVRTQIAIQGVAELDEEQAVELLERRARELARPVEGATAPAQRVEVVRFALGDEQYALAASHVRRVVRLVHLTPLPGTPSYLLGVTNYAGEVLAVFDLRRLLDLDAQALSEMSRLMVLGDDRDELGMVTDAAPTFEPLDLDSLPPPPSSLSDVGRAIVRGVTDQAVIVLDGDALLAHPMLTIDQTRGRTGAGGE